MRHARLGRFILPEQVFMVIFYILAVIVAVYRTLDFLCKMNSCQAQLCSLRFCPALPMLMSTHSLFCSAWSPIQPQEGLPGSVPASGVSELCSRTLLCTGCSRAAPLALLQLRVPRVLSAGTGGLGTQHQ